MPISAENVARAVSSGLSIVCSTCSKYWQARDNGVPGDRCMSVDGCGSPIAGDVFHEYDGPMTQFDKFCFVCGDQATHAMRVKNLVRVIGCCSTHVDMVKKMKPEGRVAPIIRVLSKTGEEMVDENSPQPKETLRLG